MSTLRTRISGFVSIFLIVATAYPLIYTIGTSDLSKNRTLISAHSLAQLPIGLVPVVAQTLAARSPDVWGARFGASQTAILHNPAQRFTARINSHGMVLQLGPDRRNRIAFELTAYRDGNVTLPVAPGVLSANGNRVQLSHGYGLSEWYVNSPLGVEQGITLAAPPKATTTNDSMQVVFSLRSNITPVQTSDGIRFKNTVDQPVLHYGELLAFDANRRPLPAEIQLEGRNLIININTANSVYPITIDPLFSAVTTFSDPNNAANDLFGVSVALSSDGNTALIGADGTTVSGKAAAGMAYVFTRTNGVWSSAPTQNFTDPVGTTGDLFGESVALSNDGNTALISAPGNNSYEGAAYLFARTNGAWPKSPSQTFNDPVAVANDQFGVRVALSGDGSAALIGANGTTVSGKSFVGAAYVYAQSNGIWPSAPTYSFADPIGAADAFGSSVALSNSGAAALIGADGTAVSGNSGAGVAYMFTQANGVWSNAPAHMFSDPHAASGDTFGSSVALSNDASVALIGATFDVPGNSNVGAAYVYVQNNGSWPSAPTQSFTDPLNGANDFFGWSIALSGDGTVALVGAYGAGEAYAYVQRNGVWSNAPYTLVNQGGNSFGISVALTSDGTGTMVGAMNTLVAGKSSAGTAYFFIPTDDLSLALSSNPETVTVGQNVTYMLTVTNNDTQVTATGLTLTDTLPSGMNLVSVNSATGTCNSSSGAVTCTLAGLAPQATWQPSIAVTATSTGSIKDSASVSASQVDSNPANNSASVTTTVNAVTPPSSGGGSGGGGGAFGLLGMLLLMPFLRYRKR